MNCNLLKAANCLVAIVGRGIPSDEAHRSDDESLAGLVRLARAHEAPVVTLQSAATGMTSMAPNSEGSLLHPVIIPASLLDKAVANAARDHGKSQLVLAGRPTEGPVTFTALGALSHGLDVIIVEDCCQSVSVHVHCIAIQRLVQAGVIMTTIPQLQFEWIATKEVRSADEVMHPYSIKRA